jgi:ABC-2 type transport system permease protein
VSAYYGPAVLALVLQHLALTLVALSLVRERTSGLIEVFRVSPTGALEVVFGKLVSFLVLGGAISFVTVALLVLGIGVPMRGDPLAVASVIGLLLVASLGVGMVIALVSDSERQVVQLSLLLLLASVFFSGFMLSLGSFTEPVQALAYALPVTHGIQLLQDLMLHGWVPEIWHLQALAAIAGVLFLVAWLGLRRGMTRI